MLVILRKGKENLPISIQGHRNEYTIKAACSEH